MPIISRIGRRTWKARLLVTSIYALLIAGGITMVYPFLLMLAGSTKSGVDLADVTLVPAYLVDDRALYAKFLEAQFNESLQQVQSIYGTRFATFHSVEPPENANEKVVDAWLSYLDKADLSPYAAFPGFSSVSLSSGCTPHVMREFKRYLRDTYGTSISRVNAALETGFSSWHSMNLGVTPPNYAMRLSSLKSSPFYESFLRFAQNVVPNDEKYVVDLQNAYRLLFLQSQFTADIGSYNQSVGRFGETAYKSWSEVTLPRRLSQAQDFTETERLLWEQFMRDYVALPWIRIDATETAAYLDYLRAKYASISALNTAYQSDYVSFDQIEFSIAAPSGGLAQTDWEGFLKGWADPSSQRVHIASANALWLQTPRFCFQDALLERYGNLAEINHTLGTSFEKLSDINPPQQEMHYMRFLRDRQWLRWEFSIRNYSSVIEYVLLQGRGVFNTVVYCVLAIICALFVNPLAAYALSRYRPPSTYRLLLIMMLTMAFPPAVTQIPVFLLLRHLGMLNSFAALLLPGLANGYWIFLLKGFFDSLPNELYESASLDGAGEIRIFWQITMSLSKPVLAVVALQAFTGAYMNFMFALLYCQDPDMWTLMVWLYQLQTNSGQGVVFASLIIAALPTFIVFALCQNIIMRGIVVPVEK